MKLRFLKHTNRPSRRDQPTHVVRMLSPMGSYPNRSLLSELGSLVIGERLCFAVLPVTPKIDAGDNYYSEVEWATLDEIKLYASALLSTDRECSYFSVYPVGRLYAIKTDAKLTDKRLLRAIRQKLIAKAFEPTSWSTSAKPQFNLQLDAGGIALPPAFGGPPYTLREEPMRLQQQRALQEAIDINDHLLIRGLSTLLRCGMIMRHYQFLEEAINTLFISLEASFRLVIRRLERRGMKNISSADAAAFIGQVFQETPLEKYFDEYYASRIMTMHPDSRYGIFPHAPLMADDCYDLRDSLMEVYAYLITGYVHESYTLRAQSPTPV